MDPKEFDKYGSRFFENLEKCGIKSFFSDHQKIYPKVIRDSRRTLRL